MATRKPTVLLTNDDGPPGPDSPYIYGLFRHLTRDLGWNVRVVIPSSQKSWIGKAYQITDVIQGRYYYPKDPDGKGETSESSRPLKDGEVAEWILLDGTPATCANIALHNMYPGEIDLLLSGPNLGRNTSGAALSSSLSGTRSIALSYGTVIHPTPSTWFEPAHSLSMRIVSHLWNNWGEDIGGLRNDEVDLYSVNIPMIERLLHEEGLQVCWTRMWRNTYGSLFKAHTNPQRAALARTVSIGGPDADTASESPAPWLERSAPQTNHADNHLVFKFSPEMKGLITPDDALLPEGSDGWAIMKGFVSVTPLRASFAEPLVLGGLAADEAIENRIWKMKL
ncbi:hypothetical protein EWM64_g3891 [Hericium alpestre]|uniref:Survival protein SurE-like phosphatase/nucleotidase domain-containing protein n=1 Tax=Hericium alpestre TaxID=135208 RepID=A0A4Z0A1F5_9AGAM|nr:hypothetical protein EWM64_g3891 [Hericium alpestre]